MEERCRHPPEIPLLYITVLDIISNAIWEDVLALHLLDVESVPLQQFAQFALRIGIGDRAAGFRFRMPRHHLSELPEPALSIRHQDPENFPGIAVIYHNFYRTTWADVILD